MSEQRVTQLQEHENELNQQMIQYIREIENDIKQNILSRYIDILYFPNGSKSDNNLSDPSRLKYLKYKQKYLTLKQIIYNQP